MHSGWDMSTRNGDRAIENAAITHVAAAERIARGIVVGFGSCDEVGVPLSDVQKIAVVQAMLLEFDGFAAHLGSLERLGRLLHELRTQ
jgi:hypothetical protein